MKISNFAHFDSAQKRALLARVCYCEAQTEAARELLIKAEEAKARRDFVQWQRRDQESARRNFELERALSPATTRTLEQAKAA